MTIENNISSIWLASLLPSPWQQVLTHSSPAKSVHEQEDFASQHNRLSQCKENECCWDPTPLRQSILVQIGQHTLFWYLTWHSINWFFYYVGGWGMEPNSIINKQPSEEIQLNILTSKEMIGFET